MRHGKSFNHLSRKVGHRKALLKNMSISLIQHKRIRTTVAKAKALRTYLEPLLTRARKIHTEEKIKDATHHRRIIFGYLQDKETVKILFDEIATKIAERDGGYLRILRTGFREKDAAEMCIIEFVDYNTDALEAQTTKRKRTRRSKKKATDTTTTTVVENTTTVVEDITSEDVEDTTETKEEE